MKQVRIAIQITEQAQTTNYITFNFVDMYFFYNICYFSLLIQYVVDIACNVSYFPSLKVKADMIGTPWSGDVDTSKVEEGKMEK